jgi:hypothetical protein
VQKLLGHGDVSNAMIYTHALEVASGAVRSPLDRLALAWSEALIKLDQERIDPRAPALLQSLFGPVG